MTEERDVGKAVVQWYRISLDKDDGQARTARARLRRCESPAETLAIAETHELNRLLKEHGYKPSAAQLALVTTTFARLRGLEGGKLAALFGSKSGLDGPRKLSELRFQALIHVRTHLELIVPLRRALAVLGPDQPCNGWALAQDLYFWNDSIRNNWCFQYFGAEFAGINQGDTDQ